MDRLIAEHGGGVEYGWQLWETLPTVLLEAEFHAIWVDANGNRRDVTPKTTPGIDESVFLHDPALVYEGRQINNVRVPLRDEPMITAFINVADKLFEATNRGLLADYHGPLRMTPELQKLTARQASLMGSIVAKFYAP